jgi:GNAT superfamily N-acetyltransferase
MRAQDFVTEIERLRTGDYQGGKDDINLFVHRSKGLTPLPGGSRYLYNITGNKQQPMIAIWDPEGKDADPGRPQPIGRVNLDSAERVVPLPGALQVGTITVDEDYRGQGIARALYGIVLAVMRRPLIAGEGQTPGGRRNWIGLSQIPGVEVRGWVAIFDDYLNPNYAPEWETKSASKKIQADAANMIDTLMGKLGAEYIGKNAINEHVFAFDVRPGRSEKELEAVIKTELSRVYNEPTNVSTGLLATWTGA